jgi:LCP family protein required for cell wall assembly
LERLEMNDLGVRKIVDISTDAGEISPVTLGTASYVSRRAFIGSIFLALGIGTLPSRIAGAQAAEEYTFAVLGTDKRTPEEPENTDTIMVSRVDMGAGTVRTLSIPRDLYVEIPGHGFDKINAAFNYAVKADPQQRWHVGAAATLETITHNFGLQFDGVAVTDMSVFPQIIDAIGGITVNNPYDYVQGTWTFPAGPIHLDGESAITFCRLREQDGDGGRVMRQHLVLRGILARLQEPSMLRRVPELITSLRDVVRTNIPADVQTKLMEMLPTLSSDDLAFRTSIACSGPTTLRTEPGSTRGTGRRCPGMLRAGSPGKLPD